MERSPRRSLSNGQGRRACLLVRKTGAYATLKEIAAEEDIGLFDYDGYDHDAMGLSLAQVVKETKARHKMGHAFVLKAMLLYGEDVTPADLENEPMLSLGID